MIRSKMYLELTLAINAMRNNQRYKQKKQVKTSFYDGDKVTCENCGNAGVIEAGGECAWCAWDEE